ncbi:Cwf19-like protein, C-terminal domain-2 [Dillenia turbinata]|uniref:Cwf19-like protein, C-terminal domain-2 n=1 Tax=Dillenia turbinata TaxID=194707 RepID=A0AAN8W2D5_9MAGN
MAPPRILLCGDVLGRLNQLFKRVSSVNKSAGPFDCLLCVGQFFPDSPDRLEEFLEYIEGRSSIPLPTYFIGDYGIGAPKVLSAASKDSANLGFKMDGLKICENLFWLRGSGKFSLHGISVVYLSGKRPPGPQFGTYSQDDVDALQALMGEPGVFDLFLTYPCSCNSLDCYSLMNGHLGLQKVLPYLICLHEFQMRQAISFFPHQILSSSISYHIAGTKDIYYAREPYSNVDAVHVTRFLGLASVGNRDKQPPNTTSSPYNVIEKTAHTKEAAEHPGASISDSQYWRYDASRKRQKHEEDGNKLCFKFISSGSCPRGEKCHFRHDVDARDQFSRGVCFDFINKGKCERGPDCSFKHSLQDEGESMSTKRSGPHSARSNRSKDCWFCLSSPSIESHLLISIGENYYCALAKGPLVQGHVLLVPIEHLSDTLSMASQYEAELSKFQESLRMCFKNQGKEVIFFEWIQKRATHANLQAIPVPFSKASIAQNIFNLAAKKLGFSFTTTKNKNSSDGRKLLKSQFDKEHSFFYVELPDCTILSRCIEENENFPVQFGREVLAGLLNIADRADWRNCKTSKEEEMQMVADFKGIFEEFDPNR